MSKLGHSAPNLCVAHAFAILQPSEPIAASSLKHTLHITAGILKADGACLEHPESSVVAGKRLQVRHCCGAGMVETSGRTARTC